MINDETLKEVVHATIAKQILAGLDTTHRDALLQNTLVDVIKDFRFTCAIEKVAAEKASEVAAKLIESEEWTQRVEQAIRDDFEDFLTQLRVAIPEALKQSFHGKQGNYGGCGAVLNCWPKPKVAKPE